MSQIDQPIYFTSKVYFDRSDGRRINWQYDGLDLDASTRYRLEQAGKFQGRFGTFGAVAFNISFRLEAKQRGGMYWYAYLKTHNKLYKRYCCKADALTSEKIEAVRSRLYDLWVLGPMGV